MTEYTKDYQVYRELKEDMRPQDPTMDGSTLTFETLEHGGEYPDQMPQVIRVTDAKGRSCNYSVVLVRSKAVDSFCFGRETVEVGKDGRLVAA